MASRRLQPAVHDVVGHRAQSGALQEAVLRSRPRAWVLGILTDVPMIMIVHPSIPAKTIAEFIDYAKKNPGKLNFGSPATAASASSPARCSSRGRHRDDPCAVQGRGRRADRSAGGADPGDVRVVGISLPPAKAGLVRALGVSSTERIAELPDLPTIAESGYPELSRQRLVWDRRADRNAGGGREKDQREHQPRARMTRRSAPR